MVSRQERDGSDYGGATAEKAFEAEASPARAVEVSKQQAGDHVLTIRLVRTASPNPRKAHMIIDIRPSKVWVARLLDQDRPARARCLLSSASPRAACLDNSLDDLSNTDVYAEARAIDHRRRVIVRRSVAVVRRPVR